MTVNEAISALHKKVRNKKIGKYAKTEDGYILIADDTTRALECYYYLVTNDGKVMPTNPVLCELDKYIVKDI